MARREVVESIAENKVEELASRDQLRKAQTEGRVARGYREGELSFKPTYKYDPASDVYDSSVKARVPAWTDRILFKSRRGDDLRLVSYAACDDVKSSDHRPVMAYFEAST
uniref:Inositol polyphosphate-related phosphatase domain-containing protein n=3 Tax=Hemiselmis andersenii TaxID=464988 RepID=A0A7S1HHQ8_HEMAN|mmetsp:Transcript_59460/g.143296  ORF Transcript_59460/g.143296 Transcript_59460/m.143296 type:complete len:110 (+) Transcript_59460:285-614(+)